MTNVFLFPCLPRDKVPRAGSSGWRDATDDPAQIARWWQASPKPNPAIALGPSGLVAIDCEGIVKHGRDGITEWERIKATLNIDDTDAWRQDTPSAGMHVIYANPAGDIPSVSERKMGDAGLEIRGNGAYIMAPGAYVVAVGDNGTYQGWYRQQNLWTKPPPRIPDALKAYIMARANPPKPDNNGHGEPSAEPNDEEILGGSYWLARAIAEAQPGGRHPTGMRLAIQLRAARLTREQAEPFMARFADHCENLGPCAEPAEKHMDKILDWVYKLADFDLQPATRGGPLPEMPEGMGNEPDEPPWLADAPDVTMLTQGENVIPAMGGDGPGGLGTKGQPQPWTLASLMGHDFPEPVWVVDELLPSGLATLGGRPKQGKSFMALQLAIATGSGGKFLTKNVVPGPVLFIALEDSPRRLQKRLQDMRAPNVGDVRFAFQWGPLNGIGLNMLERAITTDKLRLVIIDTLTRAIGGKVDWNDAGQVTGVLSALQRMALHHDTLILAIDHHRKGTAMGPDVIDDIMGSTAKAAVCDTILGLYRERGQKDATLKATGRDIDEYELKITFDALTRCWQLSADERGVIMQTTQSMILEAIEDMGGATTTELADVLDIVKQNVSRELQELRNKGLVVRCKRDGQRGVPYKLTSDPSLLSGDNDDNHDDDDSDYHDYNSGPRGNHGNHGNHQPTGGVITPGKEHGYGPDDKLPF